MAKDWVAEFDRLKAAVEKNTSLTASLVAERTKIAEMLRSNRDDPVEITKLADRLEANALDLAKAQVANTPAADILVAEAAGHTVDVTVTDPNAAPAAAPGDTTGSGASGG